VQSAQYRWIGDRRAVTCDVLGHAALEQPLERVQPTVADDDGVVATLLGPLLDRSRRIAGRLIQLSLDPGLDKDALGAPQLLSVDGRVMPRVDWGLPAAPEPRLTTPITASKAFARSMAVDSA
jgi:hypothetical protein